MYEVDSFITRNFEDYKYVGNPTSDIAIGCPFCEANIGTADAKHHLQISIDPDKQAVHCFRCGYSANWVNFVIRLTGLSYWNALGELYVVPKVRSDIADYIEKRFVPMSIDEISKECDLPKDFVLLNEATTRVADRARKYLRGRNIGANVWKKYSLGVADSVGYRVIIPIEKGYWQARAVFSWLQPKYINPKIPVKDILFNAGALEMYDEVVVCEGFFSAIAVGDNAIALLGKEATKEKRARIVNSSASKFVIALEEGAFPSMQKLADTLTRAGKDVVIWQYLQGDPADSDDYDVANYNLKTKLSLLMK